MLREDPGAAPVGGPFNSSQSCNVWFWHEADTLRTAINVRFGGKADMPTHFAYLKRITPAYWRFNRIRGTSESIR